jgi:hypothetical protein
MSGALSPLTYMLSWRAHEKLYLKGKGKAYLCLKFHDGKY